MKFSTVVECAGLLYAASLLPVSAAALPPELQPREQAFGQIVGSTHVGGRYHLTRRPFLKEGADRILELGSQSIKLWLNNAPGRNYFYNSNWGPSLRDVRSVTDLIRTPYYDEVLRLPFTTIVLMTTEFNVPNWKSGMNENKAAPVRAELQELTEYLLNEFRGSGKTFIITNWESDNNIRLGEVDSSLWPQYIQGMIDWTNARQDGIIAGRERVGMDGVTVYGAFEVNHIPLHATFAWPTTVDVVVPHTYCDLYSYSNWGTKIPGEEWQIIENLDYIAGRTPPSAYFGRRNVFLGEWGAYEVSYMRHQFPDNPADTRVHDTFSDQRHRDVVMNNLDLALRWGVPYALYWQIYCNGLRSGVPAVLGRNYIEQELRGVWLIRSPSPLLGLPYSYTSTWGSLAALVSHNRIFDDLIALDSIHEISSGIRQLDTSAPWLQGDPHRIVRTGNATESIVYRSAETIREGHLLVYHRAPDGPLAAWWPLDEWDGTRVFDHSGSALHGVRNAAVAGSTATAPTGFANPYAADFTGTEWIRIPASPLLDSTDWSLTGWFRVAETLPASGLLTIAVMDTPHGQRRFAIRLNAASGALDVRFSVLGLEHSMELPGMDLRDHQWHHFALTSGAGKTQFYLNGQRLAEENVSPDSAPQADLLLGAMPDSSGGTFQRWRGQLDDLRFYRTARSAAELADVAGQVPQVLDGRLRLALMADDPTWQALAIRADFTTQVDSSGIYRSYVRTLPTPAMEAMRMRIEISGEDAEFPQIANLALFTGNRVTHDDSFADFSAVFINSANWEIAVDAVHGNYARRSNAEPAWLVQHANSIESILHEFIRTGDGVVQYSWSYDGRLWQAVDALVQLQAAGIEHWRPTELPAGTRYVRLELSGSDPHGLRLLRSTITHAARPILPDANGRGLNDLEASWLDLNPVGPPSQFKVERLGFGMDGVQLEFNTKVGTRYRVERAVSLPDSIWEELQTFEADSESTTVLDADAVHRDASFYRIRLAPW